MEQIEFIHSVDCRACAYEIKAAPRRKLERIVQERSKAAKCKGCVRLEEVKVKV